MCSSDLSWNIHLNDRVSPYSAHIRFRNAESTQVVANMFSKSLLAALALPFVAQFVAADNTCTRSYTVQEGDICDSISAANNVSTYQFAVVNHGSVDDECDNLAPGQSYCLGWQGEDCTTTYVVQANDDCDIIAAAANINTTILYLNNPQIDDACSNIYIGEVLCTSDSVQVPPAPAGYPTGEGPIPPTATPANPDDDLPWCDEDGNPPATTSAPAPSSAAPTSSATPAPSPSGGGDDDDCDDEDDE